MVQTLVRMMFMSYFSKICSLASNVKTLESRALTRILKTGVPEPSFPKSGSPTIQKNIASLKKIGVPAKKWKFRTASQQLVRALESVQKDTKIHLIKSQDSSFKQILSSRMLNILDPDQLASKKPAYQDQQCFHITGYIRVQHGKGIDVLII